MSLLIGLNIKKVNLLVNLILDYFLKLVLRKLVANLKILLIMSYSLLKLLLIDNIIAMDCFVQFKHIKQLA